MAETMEIESGEGWNFVGKCVLFALYYRGNENPAHIFRYFQENKGDGLSLH